MKFQDRAAFGWGKTGAAYATPRAGLVIHYDGSDQGLAKKDHAACVAYWKATRKFHTGRARGWADIGYSFGACPHGYVLEGRGLNRQQAAQPGGNSTWYSCTLMSGPGEAPTTAQIEAVRQLRAWLMGKGVAGEVKGHRDFISTSCPGGKLYRLVRDGTFEKKPAGGSDSDWMEDMVEKLPMLGEGAKASEHMETLRALLAARSHSVGMKGPFDAKVKAAVKAVQKWGGVDDDGVVGPKTWPVLLRVH